MGAETFRGQRYSQGCQSAAEQQLWGSQGGPLHSFFIAGPCSGLLLCQGSLEDVCALKKGSRRQLHSLRVLSKATKGLTCGKLKSQWSFLSVGCLPIWELKIDNSARLWREEDRFWMQKHLEADGTQYWPALWWWVGHFTSPSLIFSWSKDTTCYLRRGLQITCIQANNLWGRKQSDMAKQLTLSLFRVPTRQ